MKAAQAYRQYFPDKPLTVLVDYFGKEVSDSLEVARHFSDLSGGLSGDVAETEALTVRLDTPGSRFVEGLDPGRSYAVLERHAPAALRRYLSEEQQRFFGGSGCVGGGDLASTDDTGRSGFY